MGDIQGKNNVLNQAQKYTIANFNEEFPTDDACLDRIMEDRFPGGAAHCEKCNADRKHYHVTGRTAYACERCGNHIFPLAGTIFEKSTTSLRLWFYSMYLMTATKCGISAKQVQRETGVTYKTAWRMFKQIRTLMADDDVQLEGDLEIEIDEMYHGGKAKNGNGRRLNGDKKDKVPVLGMVERGGKVVARALKNATATSAEVLPIIQKKVLPMSTIFTDEAKIYDGVGNKEDPGYLHNRINHSEAVYVMGNAHTNTDSGAW